MIIYSFNLLVDKEQDGQGGPDPRSALLLRSFGPDLYRYMQDKLHNIIQNCSQDTKVQYLTV